MKDRNELIADAHAMIANLRDAQRSALTQAFGEFRQGLHCDYILERALAYEWHIGQIRHFLDRAPSLKYDGEVDAAFQELSKPSAECDAWVKERLAAGIAGMSPPRRHAGEMVPLSVGYAVPASPIVEWADGRGRRWRIQQLGPHLGVCDACGIRTDEGDGHTPTCRVRERWAREDAQRAPASDAEAREVRAIEAQRIDAGLAEFQRMSKQRAASASPPFNAENVPESERDAAVYDAFARGHLVRDRGILYASYADWVGRLR